MSRWNAILRAMLCGAAAGVLLYIAFGEDVVGTVQNLIADVLSAAVATVALRQLFVMRARRRLAAEFATPYQDALKLLEIQERHYKSVAAWAAKGLEAISETMMRNGRYGLSYPLSADLLQARLRSLEANYGTLTFRHVASRLCAAKEIVDARMATADSIFDRADNWKRI